jgi:hypothetical protein
VPVSNWLDALGQRQNIDLLQVASSLPSGAKVPIFDPTETGQNKTKAIDASLLGGVSGPGSSTDNAVARWDGTDGDTLQDSVLVVADTTGSLSRSGGGGIQQEGTNTNDDAATGYVGEYIESIVAVGSAVSLTSGIIANVTSISLSAGDWDVSGQVALVCGASTSITRGAGAISLTSASLEDPYRSTLAGGAFTPGAVVPYAFALPRRRISISTTTTVYLTGFATFTVSTCSAFGGINARRVR